MRNYLVARAAQSQIHSQLRQRCDGLAIQLYSSQRYRSRMNSVHSFIAASHAHRSRSAVAIDKPPLVVLTAFKQSCEISPVHAARC
jgi:hypothetical protein